MKGVAMITDEIMITMAATLSTTLIIMLLAIRNTVHKKRLRKSLDWLETAKHSKYDSAGFQNLKNNIEPAYLNSSNSSSATFKLSLKISFGIAVLLGFSWWTFQLFTKGVLIWAALSGLFAVIGLILPFLIWREARQREEIKNRAGRILKQIEKNFKEAHAETAEQNLKPSLASTVSITESAPLKHTTIRVRQKIPVPEDSVLRRHVLTQLRTEIETSLFPCPTDCVLQRHYEQLVASELENRFLNPKALQRFKFIDGIEIPKVTATTSIIDVKAKSSSVEHVASTSSSPVLKYEVPEDSVLRRHLLTQQRAEVEASLFARPTDCVLQRHYEQLVASELESRLVNPEDLSLFKFIDGREPIRNVTAESKSGLIDNIINKAASKEKNEPEQITIPEDSVLRRHFISQLQSEIESAFNPRPTEATLQRHYDQLIEAELASHLQWHTNWIR